MESKFLDISESRDIDIKVLIQTLKDIRQLHDTFPELSIKVKSDYCNIKFTYEFGYCKEVSLELENEDKNGWIIKGHNLPEKSTANCLKIGSSCGLRNAVENFILVGNNLCEFFRVMDTLQSSCKVLEPVEAQRETTTWRLLKYSKFVSIKVDFPNPIDIKHMSVTFYGKQSIINELQSTYSSYNERVGIGEAEEDDYDTSDVYRDLCIKLDVLEFPAVENQAAIAEEDECAICLCHEDELRQVPFICCDNLRCECLFHVHCLSKHLNIKSTKVLATVIGECPFCKQKISSNFIGLMQNNSNLLNEEH